MKRVIILGQGLTGSAVAWRQLWAGKRVEIIDAGQERTASRISAGLITPLTGLRMTELERYEEYLSEAVSFYGKVSEILGTTLLTWSNSVRWLQTEEEQGVVQRRQEEKPDNYEVIADRGGKVLGVKMLKAARLNVREYLDGTRDYFQQRGWWMSTEVDIAADVNVEEGKVRINRLNKEAEELVFCHGYTAKENPWFPKIPNAPAKGEMLIVEMERREKYAVQHKSHWLAEEKPGQTSVPVRYQVGATYDSENRDTETTEAARAELMAALLSLTNEPFRVVEQVAGIRAAMKNRQPYIARHQEYPQLAIVNGMGSRGALLAPWVSDKLKEEVAGKRETVLMKPERKSLTELAQKIQRRVIKQGDTVVDATAGNGHDTVYLAQQVGPQGRVIAIDRQQDALIATRKRLKESGILAAVECHQEDHGEYLTQLASEQSVIAAVMFNLGYLPGSDKAVTTSPESTLKALEASVKVLRHQGAITVVAYRGHPGGEEESTAVQQFVDGLDRGKYSSETIASDAENRKSPVLTVIRKIG